MLLTSESRRISIFAFYDSEGIADDYVIYLLKQIRRFCTRQIIAVNGSLTDESRRKLEDCCDLLFCRPNSGFDITAYRDALNRIRNNLDQYDEILFYNQTIFGPVCSPEPMFLEMGSRDIDFWGLTRHKGAPKAAWDNTTAIPPHIQSFFFAVRRSMFSDERFLAYWDSLPEIRTYWDAVGKHEIIFTRHFESMGFRWDVFVPTDDLEICNDYPLMGMPVMLLRERGCPFFKRKSFLEPRCNYTTVPQGQASQQLYDYIRTETSYPVSYVFQNLLRTAPLSSVCGALNLCFDAQSTALSDAPVAAVLVIPDEASASVLARTASGFPASVRCFALFASDELMYRYKSMLPAGSVCIAGEDCGPRPVFGSLWPQLKEFPYLLYLSGMLAPVTEEFFDMTSLLAAVDSLQPARCAAVLEQHPEIGVLCPLMPSHQETATLGCSLPAARDRITSLLAEAGIRVPVSSGSPGIASRGGMFFARTDAVSALTDFPFEREAVCSGKYPLWEYLPMLAAQSAGAMTGFITVREHLLGEFFNRSSMLGEIFMMWATPEKTRVDQIRFRMQSILDFYYERRYQMTLEQAFHADLSAKQKLWICLQILMKPEHFEKLHRLLHRGAVLPAEHPKDDLD